MCSNYFVRNFDEKERTFSNMISRVKEKEPNPKEITFTGGEPFTNPEIFEMIDKFRGLYPNTQINVLSNGRVFHYPNYAKKLKKHFDDNMQIAVSILGSNPKIHDSVTLSPGSFKQTTQGLKNLLKLKIPIELRVIITKKNFNDLRGMAEYISNNFSGVRYVIFIFVDLISNALKNKDEIAVTYLETIPHLTNALDILDKNNIDSRLYHFPLCVLPKRFWSKAWISVEKTKVQEMVQCKGCLYSDECVGVLKGYYFVFGEKEFIKPKKEKIIYGNNIYNPIIEVKNE